MSKVFAGDSRWPACPGLVGNVSCAFDFTLRGIAARTCHSWRETVGSLDALQSRPQSPAKRDLRQNEKPSKMPTPFLDSLRGDFFCLPFGGNGEEVVGKMHRTHGEILIDA